MARPCIFTRKINDGSTNCGGVELSGSRRLDPLEFEPVCHSLGFVPVGAVVVQFFFSQKFLVAELAVNDRIVATMVSLLV